MPSEEQPDQRFPVRLTQAQRKVAAEIAPELAERLRLDEQNQRTVSFTLTELQAIEAKAGAAIHKAGTGMIRNSLRRVADLTTQAISRARSVGAIPAAQRLYQFKITLLGIEAAIWRRIHTKDCTLDKLHEHIQMSMGWTNSQDVGGIGSYAYFLEAIRDEDHERHGMMLEWVGGQFDPEAFDPAKATKEMWRGLPDWRKRG